MLPPARHLLPQCLLLAALLACGVTWNARLQAGEEEKGPSLTEVRKEIAALEERLSKDLLNERAARQLTDLRKTERTLRRAAFGELAAGLEAYLAGQFAPAARKLSAAQESPAVVSLADKELPHPLDALIRDAKGRSAKAQGDESCYLCGGTGMVDCSTCKGAGLVACDECDGKGYEAREIRGTEVKVPCKACNAIGVETCDRCEGKGWVPCTRCESPPAGAGANAVSGIPASARQAMRVTIRKARYLQRGGVDVESPSATAPSPAPLRKP